MRPVVTDGIAWSVGLFVTIVSPEKTAELIEEPFGTWTRVGPRIRVLDRVHSGANWRIRLNCLCAAEMRPDVKSI